ncbi:MAG TPA: hypothetical protein VIC87_00390, partial [Vicinamibacteria bacterium]
MRKWTLFSLLALGTTAGLAALAVPHLLRARMGKVSTLGASAERPRALAGSLRRPGPAAQPRPAAPDETLDPGTAPARSGPAPALKRTLDELRSLGYLDGMSPATPGRI